MTQLTLASGGKGGYPCWRPQTASTVLAEGPRDEEAGVGASQVHAQWGKI